MWVGTAKIDRSGCNFIAFTLRLTLPSDVDVLQIQPVFQCTENTAKVYLNDQVQESGVSIVDFNQPLTYKVVSQSTDKADFSSISYFEIILN